MRPTLIQQKSVFGQEPMAGARPARGSAAGVPSGLCFWAYFAGLFGGIEILFCGLARGFGHFAVPFCVGLLPCAFAALFCAAIAGRRAWRSWGRLPWIGIVGTSAAMTGLFYLPQGSSAFVFVLFLLVLFSLSPATGRGKCTLPVGTGRIGLIALAGLLLGAFSLPQLVTRNRQPWIIPGPAPAARTNSNSLPTMTGTWQGRFGSNPALLMVSRQRSQMFEGNLVVRESGYTDRIAVQGEVDPTGTVDIQEKRILDEPFYGDWALGIDRGGLSSTALEMKGRGVDARRSRYHWIFERVSAAVFNPKD
ncbi:MAG TPA: hypothetical protein VFJ58_10805 [Armatimonadota bacterium]|nr:hypothetical protein [Armatimonadota bacterium]